MHELLTRSMCRYNTPMLLKRFVLWRQGSSPRAVQTRALQTIFVCEAGPVYSSTQ